MLGCAHVLEATGLAGDPGSPVHRLDPRAKVIGLVGLTLVAVTASLPRWPVLLACGIVLAAVAAVARVPARTVWRRARAVLPLVVLVALSVPFVHRGGAAWTLGPLTVSEAGLAVFAAATLKAALGTVSAVLLGATTPFPATLRALQALRVPALLVLIAASTYRYLFVLADEVQRMRTALVARGYRPRHALQLAALGRMATALFLRAHARGERVHLSMRARGFTTASSLGAPLRSLGAGDPAFVALVAGAPLVLRIGLEVLP